MLDGIVSENFARQIGDNIAASHLSEVNRNHKIWAADILLLQPSRTRYSVYQAIGAEEDYILVQPWQ